MRRFMQEFNCLAISAHVVHNLNPQKHSNANTGCILFQVVSLKSQAKNVVTVVKMPLEKMRVISNYVINSFWGLRLTG